MNRTELLMTANSAPIHQEFAPQPADDERLSLRERAMGVLGKFATRAGAVVAAVGLSLGLTQPAEASDKPSCYGDWCSGQYARDTGCDRDARTIAKAIITQTDQQLSVTFSGEPGITVTPAGAEKVGTLTLRYSDECGTGWSVLNTNRASGINSVGVEHSGGYEQSRDIGGFWSGSPAAKSHSPMVYTRSEELRGFIEGTGFLQGFENGTEFVNP